MNNQIQIARKAYFSSAHRYHQPQLSLEENLRIYGGAHRVHGHDYTVTCTLEGPVDSVTGLVVNLVDVDKVLKQVIAPMDQNFLNESVQFFQTRVPTTENLALYFFETLSALWNHPGVRIVGVRVEESAELWAEYPA